LSASELTRYAQHSLTGGVKVVAGDGGEVEGDGEDEDNEDENQSHAVLGR